MPSFYEFFAGGGMARIGLGQDWNCVFANDISDIKADAYLKNFPDLEPVLAHSNINDLNAPQLPGKADLIWASFPCQDLSLAGAGKGLKGLRSGLVWKLLSLVEDLKREKRGPKTLVLENVTGLLNVREGQDFYDILRALRGHGYIFGTLMMDAVHFLPHSRPRVFLVAVDIDQIPVGARHINGRLAKNYPWTSQRLDSLWEKAPFELRDSWVWWSVPPAPPRNLRLRDIIEHDATNWDAPEYTARLVSLMSPLNHKKVEAAKSRNQTAIGTLYRRTRLIDDERKQRVEVRFDDISGCLRTPTGGSSRQRLLFVTRNRVRSRLLTTREAARLMGVPEGYKLPSSYNDAYQIAGDGVAVPVVSWLSENLLLPLLRAETLTTEEHEVTLLYA